ncbi:TraB/GumN family protein [Hydrogenophaga sp. 5NK40-0174]|uniref:TraB/GumN family protein n=1 Tax=Hydrogenophaga sp. 5NK40-0174 TaxID=3127649 RepID=UPI003108F96F
MFRAAAETAQDRGFLWRFGHKGRVSYLYGTSHAGRAEWLAPGPKLRSALMSATAIAVEVDISNTKVQNAMASSMDSAPRDLPDGLRQRVTAAWEAECLPAQALERGPTEVLVAQLEVARLARSGFHAMYGSEFLLLSVGHARQLPIVSLEDVDTQVAALSAPDNASAVKLIDSMLNDMADDESGERAMRLINAWANRDLMSLEAFETWCECLNTEQEREQMKRLLDDRNPGLADGIAAAHEQGHLLFAAVGALHMIGPKGVPALLKAKGYEVQRVF